MLVQLYGNSSPILSLTGYSVRWFKLITQKEHEPESSASPKNFLSGKLVSNMAREWLVQKPG